MAKEKILHGVKYHIDNFHCDNCETGVVQIINTVMKNGYRKTHVSGCLDCGKRFGILQAGHLKPYSRNDLRYSI